MVIKNISLDDEYIKIYSFKKKMEMGKKSTTIYDVLSNGPPSYGHLLVIMFCTIYK